MIDSNTTAISAKEEWPETDRRMMARALSLAAEGVGRVSPGPLVGCVIVDARGEVVGEGYYLYEQVKHAETVALEQAGTRARGATAYVSLEPHAHHGRTPPCTGALITAGIRRVVAPIEDLNPEVSGKGFAHLRAAGLEVHTGLLAHEAQRLNEKYLHFMRTGRPFVHLKLAITLDGKVATRTGASRWITGDEARARVHVLRHEHDAILIGGRTGAIDDPLLTDRSGRTRRRPLTRVVLDRRGHLATDSQLANTATEAPVILFTGRDSSSVNWAQLESRGIQIIRNETSDHDLTEVLQELGSRSIQSVLVEGGPDVAGRFVDSGLVDKVTFFVAPIIVGGRESPAAVGGVGVEKLDDAVQLEEVEITQRGRDLEITGYPRARMKAEG